MSAFDAYVQAKYHGGTIPGGPTFTVVHDAETPLRTGYADSIAEYFRVGPASGTSAHGMVDPSKAIKMLPDNVVAYAAGPYANTFGWHLEQAGYARFTPAEWSTADGMAQMRRLGACLREVHDTWGIPKRWCTDDQLRAAAKGDRASGGMTTHQQVARVLGGTTHTDPETNYPRDLLLAIVTGTTSGGLFMSLTPDEERRILKFADDWGYLLPQVKSNTDMIPKAAAAVDQIAWGVLDENQGLRVAVSGLYAKLAEVGTHGITAADIAAAIPDGIAADVADELQRRLAS